ncbi:MAG: glycosyl hydrolase family 65 protein [Bacillota bacterium]|nr:glycosyl hydrolase family 65 protein [Bacillota bacterium]MDW7677858.1 glycosyl hydrolase family 65 protein [Bacillota bacterium]
MGRRSKETEPFYGKDPWKIVETEYKAERNFLDETIFSLGNGHIGTRGTLEEGYDGPAGTSMEGTYLNGFFEKVPIHYDETAYGYATHTETMLNLPNGKVIQVMVEDELLSLFTGSLETYHRELDLQQGVLRRHMRWISPKGRMVNVETERLVSLVDDRLMLIRYAITPVNFTGKITLISMLDGHVRNQTAENDPRIGTSLAGQTLKLEKIEQTGDISRLLQVTPFSKLQLLSAVAHFIESDQPYQRENLIHGQLAEHRYIFEAAQGEQIGLTKAIMYRSKVKGDPIALWESADKPLLRALQQGWAHYHLLQRQVMDDFWLHSDVAIQGDDLLQQGMHFNLFHLFQSAGKDGKTNIAAKGLTGEGYQGHYFWDSEIYIVPYFTFTQPWVARQLLAYRYHTLDQARQRAQKLFRKPGALYPWRTITGIECSSYYPAGTAQYHINADIAYAVRQYVEATGDISFLLEHGAEIVFETARIWMYIGSYSPLEKAQFSIHTVTGPDEYSALVSNNFYTNSMARMHLHYAVAVAEQLLTDYSGEYERISQKISLRQEELQAWTKAAEKMMLPCDDRLGIHPQDDSFLEKEVWPFEETPEDHYPLLLHYHPLDIYRHQVCKQADVVLALYLLHDQFTLEEKKTDLAYYEPITTHDSSLSKCIYSIMAAETGDVDHALSLFMDIARLDLDNHQGNAQHGIHTASMAGTWLSLVAGFAGMRLKDGFISLTPQLPPKWQSYGFRLKFRGNCIKITVSDTTVQAELLEGEEMILLLDGKKETIKSGDVSVFSRKPPADHINAVQA